MKYYSELLDEKFDTERECLDAEQEFRDYIKQSEQCISYTLTVITNIKQADAALKLHNRAKEVNLCQLKI